MILEINSFVKNLKIENDYIKMLQPFMYSQKWQLQGQFSRPSAVGMGINGRIEKGHSY